MPLIRERYQRLEVFTGIDFTVAKGEFFGIVGRNGSGKSTLLKVIAGIYPADAGRVEIHGRLAPVLDLGVGFNPDLPTRDNAVINGVMLGLSSRQARARTDAILDFAELHEFAEMRLKNLSSGMKVRLAFASMLQTDPDVMLIDEVLAVGDKAFQEKCAESMAERRRRGKTVVLVTHAMPAVERLCDRAMLLEDGLIEQIGDPGTVAARYLEVNLEHTELAGESPADEEAEQGSLGFVHIASASLVDGAGQRRATATPEEPLELAATLEVTRPIEGAALQIEICNDRGGRMFMPPPMPILDAEGSRLRAGDQPTLRLEIENRFLPGSYTARLSILRTSRHRGELPASRPVEVPFVVSGSTRRGAGSMALRHALVVENLAPRTGAGVG